jgi:hypothetical protein
VASAGLGQWWIGWAEVLGWIGGLRLLKCRFRVVV